ncbi:hypothetical protein [Lentibacillus jeotgali]|uniref:hypothetical protein n=1 Tax=Lentibacillus jeotgali TaxID=558169 RepID=UPI0002625C19|nr:hypothetical protein [Lentibacillus jeotgali]
MSQIVQAYIKQEWDDYDMNLAKALKAIEQDDLDHASIYFQRIAWALRSLDKYHPPERKESEFESISIMQERMDW